MNVKQPTDDELRFIAAEYNLDLSDADLASFQGLIAASLPAYQRIHELTEPKLEVKYPRTAGYRPQPEDNLLNAWYYKTSIKGTPSGPLSGKRIVIKDNVCVAGVPMMNGTSALEGYVPDVDATVVTRILDAGGEIVGKAECESLCFSGGSHTNENGPIRNPYNPAHTTGGSSAGSAALVANGEVDMAIGGDQGGSVRIPACWCGIYGMKPTHGLVPYTGAFPIEITIDHLGPMANSTADCALLLEAIAGKDGGLDPRQYDVKTAAYTKALTGDVKGLKIGVVEEGFGRANSEADVDASVRAAGQRFEQLGAKVTSVSIPMHLDGQAIWTGIATEGAAMLMIKGNSMGTNWKGYYTTSLLDVFARGRITRANDLSETTKMVFLLGQYMQDKYHGRFYAKAQNLSRSLKAAYDKAFEDFDLLLMPTLPMKATPIPAPDCSREEYVQRALEMLANTSPFDVTGQPAMSVPCGMSQGLPIGMMLVGRDYDESTIFRASHAFETSVDWKTI
ncbi:MAG: amidase [Proteobacteria bacterium]|nr:amidase [Pseudomonadota bacterium]